MDQLGGKNRVETTVGSRSAHRGIRVPTGMGLGKLKDKVELRNSRRLCATYVPGVIAVVQFVVHAEYLICFSFQGVSLRKEWAHKSMALPDMHHRH